MNRVDCERRSQKVRHASNDADALIAENLRKSYAMYGNATLLGIKIGVAGGHVTLRGSVDREFLRADAERIARLSSGVARVTNRIAVKRDVMASL